MAREAGIPLIELFETTDQINQALPGGVAEFFRRFVAIDLESRISTGAVIHTGKLQSFVAGVLNNDMTEFNLGFGTLRIPLVTNGIPFQLSQSRAATTGDLEPGAESWQFDVLINDLTLTLNGLVGADLIPAAATMPRHLVAKAGEPPVAITGSAGLRFEKTGPDQGVSVLLFDPTAGSDPFVPMQQSGDVFQVTCTPPHFMIGKSQFGMTLKNILVDTSKKYSPAFVIERGQPADWVGLAIEEAAVYLPPNALGGAGFSASISDFLIGDPAGLQARLEVQFGRSPLQASTFVFRQDGANITTGFDFSAGTLEITARPGEQVEIEAALTFTTPPGDSGIDHWEARFDFPGQTSVTGASGKGNVRHGEVLTITPIEVLGTGASERRIDKPAFTVRMVASGTAPAISVTTGTTTLANVVDLTGPRDTMNGLVLTATPSPADPNATFHWLSPALGIDQTATSLTLAIAGAVRGIQHIAVTQVNSNNGASRIRLRIREPEEGALYIGCQAGVFAADAPTTLVPVAEILGNYDLAAFHEKAALNGASASATLSGTSVSVPAGVISEVVINEGGAAAETEELRHIQVMYQFDDAGFFSWRMVKPGQTGGFGPDSNSRSDLLAWAAKFPGAEFQIIGRCDDVGGDTYNLGLAESRANAAKTFLTTSVNNVTAVDPAKVHVDGEQSINGLLAGSAHLIDPDLADDTSPIGPDSPAHPGRYIEVAEDRSTWPKTSTGEGRRENPPNDAVENIRKQYRRADIYAVGGVAQGDAVVTISKALDPTRRRVLVPASGRAVIPSDNDNSKADYRVKLVVAWDRARFTGWTDIIPNLAEFEYAWTPSPADNISLDSQVLTVYGKYIFDDLTGFTEITVGLKSEGDTDGLLSLSQPNLVAALAFGPMLASGVDFDNDAFGSAVRLGALGTIAGFASVNLGDGPLVGAESKTALIGVEAKASTRTIRDPLQAFKAQLTVDYTNTLHINGGVLGLKTDPNQPMKIRYSKIGVEFDTTDPDAALLDKFGFVYASDAMTIEDSGLWKITGPLGKLLRISEFKLGVGSFWIEPTLALAVNIGVVEISEASFRVTFDLDANGDPVIPPGFSLRGLKAKIDIPNTLTGEGRLKIEENGVVRAGVDITIVPLKMRVEAALAFGSPPEIDPAIFLSLYAKVQFPGGIPL
ncbi:MAG TPA: hypothetical protein ENK28_00430, partial [Aliiroseovarius sp.]|nr:hypothetical protein [Aliiroseovarius sp.]